MTMVLAMPYDDVASIIESILPCFSFTIVATEKEPPEHKKADLLADMLLRSFMPMTLILCLFFGIDR